MKMHRTVRFFVLVLVALLYAGPLTAQNSGTRRIPDDNLAYPLLITVNNTAGSGFLLNTGMNLFLVTAKHVLFMDDGRTPHGPRAIILSYGRDLSDRIPARITVDLAALMMSGNLQAHATQDVVVARIATTIPIAGKPGQFATAWTLGVSEDNAPPSGLVAVIPAGVKRFADVLISNDVVVFGYPNSIGIPNSPQIDPSRPLLRKGIVAGLNGAQKTIVLDCPLYPGNSGGPVIELDANGVETQFRVIGVAIQYVPFDPSGRGLNLQNSGYSIAASMDSVLELVTELE